MAYLSKKELKKMNFKKIGKNILISDKASIITPSKIEIDDNTRIDDFSLLYGSIKIGIIYLVILSFLSWLVTYILFKRGYKIKS